MQTVIEAIDVGDGSQKYTSDEGSDYSASDDEEMVRVDSKACLTEQSSEQRFPSLAKIMHQDKALAHINEQDSDACASVMELAEESEMTEMIAYEEDDDEGSNFKYTGKKMAPSDSH